MKKAETLLVMFMAASLALGLLSGCSSSEPASGGDAAGTTFVLGDTTFNAENEEPDVNPHNAYSGWACIRYGIGETLFRYSDSMEIEPWLATDYELVDERTWRITLRDGVTFSSGRALDGEAVKECLEHLIEVHDRARGDLMIDSISADGQTVMITTAEPRPTLLNYLSDPYGCIIDMEAGITEDGIVSGTGPYIAASLVTGEELNLVKNENYCKNRHPSPICTRFEHHFHALKPHLHRRSFSDTLPENQRHLIALKRPSLWHIQKLCQLSQPAELGQLSSGTGMPFSVKMFSNCRIRSRCRWSSFSAA